MLLSSYSSSFPSAHMITALLCLFEYSMLTHLCRLIAIALCSSRRCLTLLGAIRPTPVCHSQLFIPTFCTCTSHPLPSQALWPGLHLSGAIAAPGRLPHSLRGAAFKLLLASSAQEDLRAAGFLTFLAPMPLLGGRAGPATNPHHIHKAHLSLPVSTRWFPCLKAYRQRELQLLMFTPFVSR